MCKVYLERSGAHWTVDVRDHAGMEELCAAVSCLLYSLCGWLHNAHVEIVRERMQPGDACISWRPDWPDGIEESNAVFEFVMIGFLQLEKWNPEQISVTICDE